MTAERKHLPEGGDQNQSETPAVGGARRPHSGSCSSALSDPTIPHLPGAVHVTAQHALSVTRPVIQRDLPGLQRGMTGLIVGEGGVGKSWLLLQIYITGLVRHDVFGLFRGESIDTLKMHIFSFEDDEILSTNRIRDIAATYDVEMSHNEGWAEWMREIGFALPCGTSLSEAISSAPQRREHQVIHLRGDSAEPWYLQSREGVQITPNLKRCLDYTAECGATVYAVDTKSVASAGIEENDNSAAAFQVHAHNQMNQVRGISGLFVMHTTQAARDPRSRNYHRGAAAWSMNTRHAENVFSADHDEWERDKMKREDHKRFVKLYRAKSSAGPDGQERLFLRSSSGPLLPIPSIEHAYAYESWSNWIASDPRCAPTGALPNQRHTSDDQSDDLGQKQPRSVRVADLMARTKERPYA